MQKIKVGIVGGAGYTGGELIRLLIYHPHAEIIFVKSKSNAGNVLSKVHHDLAGETNMTFTSELDAAIDVLFLCTGHGEAKKFLRENVIPEEIKIIDLSNDFRLAPNSKFGTRRFVYGL